MIPLRSTLMSWIQRNPFKMNSLEWRMVNYYFSQQGEDVYLRGQSLPEKGFYVDIGASHPIQYSNTHYFYKKGWEGITVDGDQQNQILYAKYRPHQKHLNEILWDQEIEGEFYIYESPIYNTFLKSRMEFLRDHENRVPVKTISCRSSTLKKVLDHHLPKGKKVDLLNVDCEGADLAVLKGNDWEQYRPEWIIAEDFEENPQSEMCLWLKEKGYSHKITLGFSKIFKNNALRSL